MFQMCYYHQHACLLVCMSLLPAGVSVKLQWMIQVTREIQGNSKIQEFWVCGTAGQGGGLSLQPNFKKGRLGRTSTFRGGCWEREG